jgi:threonine/homoserine/homoserine lactone efflux protein
MSALTALLVLHWLVTMSPGANTLLVAQTAAASGRANAFAVIAGICASGAIWVSSAAFGLRAVFLASPWLYALVAFAGAGYLVWLGIKLLRSRRSTSEAQVAGYRPLPLRVSFVRGFATNITNPKSLVYFSSVFGTFLQPEAGAGTVLVVVLITWACNVGWYGTLSFVLSTASAQRAYGRVALTTNRIAGLTMVLFGLSAAAGPLLSAR